MKYILIGQLLGSILTSEHDNEEACLGRKAILEKKGASAQCVAPQGLIGTATGVYYGVTPNFK